MLSAFPPGDTRSPGCSKPRERCLWRETALMRELLCRAVTPLMGLYETLQCWSGVQRQLAEPPRKRQSQRTRAFEMLG